MEKKQDFWQRLSQYLVFVAGVLLIVVAWLLSRAPEAELMGTPTAVADQPLGAALSLEPTAVITQTVANAYTAVGSNLPVLYDANLAPDPNPHTYQAKPPTHDFQKHVIQDMDTPNSIALEYGISAETIIGGNPNMARESNMLQTGAELTILPVDGVLHTVKPGETLESISQLYGVSVEEIIGFPSNNLEYPFLRLLTDSQLLIPGASIGQFTFIAPKSVGNSGGQQQWAVVGTGSYIWPVNGRCLTQFYSGFHPGIDVSTAEGSSVYASDTGTVTYASYAAGVYYDYGNLIVINHGNGSETFYAHLSSISVYPGQIVYQGDYIGATGNTGRSSGPHLHFEIRDNDYRGNPLNRLGGPVTTCS